MNQSIGASSFVGIFCIAAVTIGSYQIQRGKPTSGLFLVSLGMLGLLGLTRGARM